MTRKHTKVKPVSPGKAPPPSGRVYSKYDQARQRSKAEKEKKRARDRDRYKAEKKHGKAALKGKDVHHVNGAASGGKTRIISASANRAKK